MAFIDRFLFNGKKGLEIDKMTAENPFWFRRILYRWIYVLCFIGSIISLIFSKIHPTNFFSFSLIASIATFVLVFLSFWKNIYININLLGLLITITFFFQCYYIQSSSILMGLAFVIILIGLFDDSNAIHLFMIIIIIGVLLYLKLGILTWVQQFDEETGIALVNNVTALFPMLFIGYGISLLINRILLRVINTQSVQYLALQSRKEILEKTLKEIKTLKELLPICASCKKIRDGAGNWNQLENYISKNTNTKFSHGYCPECAAKILNEQEKI